MKELTLLFACLVGIMFLGFLIAFIRSFIWKIVFYIKKRKAIKNRTDDRWLYEI